MIPLGWLRNNGDPPTAIAFDVRLKPGKGLRPFARLIYVAST
jgi:hypothetical protein